MRASSVSLSPVRSDGLTRAEAPASSAACLSASPPASKTARTCRVLLPRLSASDNFRAGEVTDFGAEHDGVRGLLADLKQAGERLGIVDHLECGSQCGLELGPCRASHRRRARRAGAPLRAPRGSGSHTCAGNRGRAGGGNGDGVRGFGSGKSDRDRPSCGWSSDRPGRSVRSAMR